MKPNTAMARRSLSCFLFFFVLLLLTRVGARLFLLIDLELGSRSLFNIRQVTTEDNGNVHVLFASLCGDSSPGGRLLHLKSPGYLNIPL
jgi:hypothetical protein